VDGPPVTGDPYRFESMLIWKEKGQKRMDETPEKKLQG